MPTKEITADTHDDLERLVQIEEANGWTREGAVEPVHPTPPGSDGVVGLTSYLQVMRKDDE